MQEYIVVTLLVAATGKLDLPKVQSQEQLVTALNRLAALRQDQVLQNSGNLPSLSPSLLRSRSGIAAVLHDSCWGLAVSLAIDLDLLVVLANLLAACADAAQQLNRSDACKVALITDGAACTGQIMAVEVLWTPEDEDDTYSRDEMLLDYPALNNV